MNFIDIHNDYIHVEQTVECEPERPLILRNHGVDTLIEVPKNFEIPPINICLITGKEIQPPENPAPPKSPSKVNCLLAELPRREKPSIYLHLSLLSGHISHKAIQESNVEKTEDGLFEGTYSVQRRLVLSREAFTAIVIKTLDFWRDVQTYYMINGGGRKFNKFRDIVVIREERLAPITLKLNDYFHEYYGHKFRLKKDPAGIIIPLVAFSRTAFDLLVEEPVLTIPEYLGEQEVVIQNLLDSTLSKLPKWYL